MAGLRVDALVAMSLAAAGSFVVVSAAKPPKPQPVTATLTFRCLADDPGSPGPCDPLGSGGTDRFRDDGMLYSGVIDTGGLFTPLIVTPTNGRLFNIHLGLFIPGTRRCDSVGNCHPTNFSGGADLALNNVQFRVKPLVPVTWEDLPGLLFGMSTCGAPQPALVHYTFWLPDGNGHWGFNFNPRAYPGTTAAIVVRVTPTTWTVEAEADDIGELLSWGHTGIRRNNGPSGEGHFNMPFRATIQAGGLPAGAGTCN